MHIRLTRKLAEVVNGLDLRSFTVGQIIDLKDAPALMLLREGWAEPAKLTVDDVDVAVDGDRTTSRRRRQRAVRSGR